MSRYIVLLEDKVRLQVLYGFSPVHWHLFCELGGLAPKKSPSLCNHPTVKEVAKTYPGATPAQILLNWGLARGCSVVPKSVKPGWIVSWRSIYR